MNGAADDGVLALDAHAYDVHLDRFLGGLAVDGVDGLVVVYFRGRNSGVATCRHPRGHRLPYAELRALALAAITAAQSQDSVS